ncbi:MAG: hypothetical protein H0V21_05615 [Rubrobacter sp.]|nr:hypothetical protein [Rubrobacter sp.]
MLEIAIHAAHAPTASRKLCLVSFGLKPLFVLLAESNALDVVSRTMAASGCPFAVFKHAEGYTFLAVAPSVSSTFLWRVEGHLLGARTLGTVELG